MLILQHRKEKKDVQEKQQMIQHKIDNQEAVEWHHHK